MGKISKLLGVVYLFVALYLVNAAFELVVLPAGILVIEILIFLIAAILIGIVGVKAFLKKEQSGILG